MKRNFDHNISQIETFLNIGFPLGKEFLAKANHSNDPLWPAV